MIKNNFRVSNIVKTDFQKIVDEVISNLKKDWSSVILDLYDFEKREEAQKRVIDAIERIIREHGFIYEELTDKELANKVYIDSFEFSFLNKYIYNDEVEEINGNSWDCIWVYYKDGRKERIPEKFNSREEAISIIKRVLRVSNTKIDAVSPSGLGDIGKNKRISAMIYPLIDKEVGVSFSIRNVHINSINKKMLVNSGTATDEIIEFLLDVLNYGISFCISGGTGSGKTTFLNYLLNNIDISKRVYTLEDKTRELDLLKYDDKGNVINDVVSTLAMESEDESKEITLNDLLALALRFHPDLIVVGETRTDVTLTAVKSANTGHPVGLTIHASNGLDTYDRILALCLENDIKMEAELLYQQIIKAFPIIVHVSQLADGSRKIMEVLESYIDENKEVKYNTLYRYKIMKNIENEDGSITVLGEFIKENEISGVLCDYFLMNGMPDERLSKYKG